MHKALMVVAGLLLTTAIAGCGSAAASTSASGASSAGSAYGSSSSGTSSSSTGSQSTSSTTAVIKIGTAKVSGKSTTVLENSQGHTLYYFTKDTPTHSACDANKTCSALWHALKAGSVPKVSGASGTFSLLKGQVEYNGHPLYAYTGDTAPGQAKGEGLFKEWWVATPSLKAAAASGSGTGSSGGSGSGSGW